MSSVPAPRIERLPLSPRGHGATPEPAAAPLRLVPSVPELFPGLIATIREALVNDRARRSLGSSRALAEVGRATGARV